MPELVTRAQAELRGVVDGDTYDLLVDVLQTRLRRGAQTMRVRLRDFSCPETRRGTPEQRARGRAAKAAAYDLLTGFELDRVITVELKGQDSLGREVGWLWVATSPTFEDVAVGPELERLGHARPGAFMG